MREKGFKTAIYPARTRALRAILCFALAAGILLLSRAAWKRLRIAPIFSLAPAASATPAPADAAAAEARETREVALPGGEWYALQLGAFTGEEAAQRLALQYIPRGAAGLVLLREDAFRVFAAAYPTRAEAQKVQTRLAQQGVSTYIQTFSRAALTLRAGGSKKQLNALTEACAYLAGLENKLYAVYTGLDAGQMDAQSALAALSSEGVTSAQLAEGLARAFDGAVPPAVEPLRALLNALSQSAADAQASESAARTGAALKYCHLLLIAGLIDFSQGV